MNVRKRKRRSDSKCTHNEEAFSRKWNDRLYCMECQKESVKRSRQRTKLKKVEKDAKLAAPLFSDQA